MHPGHWETEPVDQKAPSPNHTPETLGESRQYIPG